MTWIYDTALKRAEKFGIEGVTYQLTLGVVKNIIPAIASTNATIAAACCNECIKVLSYIAPTVENYMMYMGKVGLNISTFELAQLSSCFVCNSRPIPLQLSRLTTVSALIDLYVSCMTKPMRTFLNFEYNPELFRRALFISGEAACAACSPHAQTLQDSSVGYKT